MSEPTADDGDDADERDSPDRDERRPLADRLGDVPVSGGVLLALGSAVLTWQVVAAFETTAALWTAPLGLGALLGVLSLAGIAAVAQLRPDYSTEGGIASVFVAVSAVTLLLVSPGELGTPDRLFLGLLVGSAGGALCVGSRSSSDSRPSWS
jgi:peptidoglycan/LPS O-acetylase OafA/YrhL